MSFHSLLTTGLVGLVALAGCSKSVERYDDQLVGNFGNGNTSQVIAELQAEVGSLAGRVDTLTQLTSDQQAMIQQLIQLREQDLLRLANAEGGIEKLKDAYKHLSDRHLALEQTVSHQEAKLIFAHEMIAKHEEALKAQEQRLNKLDKTQFEQDQMIAKHRQAIDDLFVLYKKLAEQIGNSGDRTVLARLHALEQKTQAMRHTLVEGRPSVVFEKVNVHVRNGYGKTLGQNGLGNLVIGYNERTRGLPTRRGGSHNVVIGMAHSYTSVAGLVAGFENRITAPFATVTGGRRNTAAGLASSISGGKKLFTCAAYQWKAGNRFYYPHFPLAQNEIRLCRKWWPMHLSAMPIASLSPQAQNAAIDEALSAAPAELAEAELDDESIAVDSDDSIEATLSDEDK